MHSGSITKSAKDYRRLLMVDKFCIFCGAEPKERSREHILPQWLIELTGDPRRKAVFGPFFDERTRELTFRNFAFDEFAFAACEECNLRFSRLESATKEIMVKLLAKSPAQSKDFHTLLTWLDKVRVGLWLVSYVIQKNISAITPQYYINSRIDMFDRMVFLYKSNFKGSRLRFEGTTAPAFQYSPTCFVVIVNDLFFFNVSTDFLLSKTMGLPYPTKMSYTNTPRMEVDLVSGRERMIWPLVRMRYNRHCSEIYQPMIRRAILCKDPYYDSSYVKSLCSDYRRGIGRIFYSFGPSVTEFPETESRVWIPNVTWDDDELVKVSRRQMLEFQIHLNEYGPMQRKIGSVVNMDKKKKELVEAQIKTAKSINRMFLKRLMSEDD
jgi:hypothetical protein